jgi:hypothetical protein
VAEFLTSEWLTELDGAARTSPALAALGRSGGFVVEQQVRGAPSGDVSYHLAVDASGAQVRPGPAASPVVVVLTDYTTAVELHRGTTNLQRALASGGAQVRGEPRRLLAHADALGVLDDVFAAVRAATTYAPTP